MSTLDPTQNFMSLSSPLTRVLENLPHVSECIFPAWMGVHAKLAIGLALVSDATEVKYSARRARGLFHKYDGTSLTSCVEGSDLPP